MFKYIAAVLTIICLVVIMPTLDAEDQIKMDNEYCNNVELWESSEREFGHPDYDQIGCD